MLPKTPKDSGNSGRHYERDCLTPDRTGSLTKVYATAAGSQPRTVSVILEPPAKPSTQTRVELYPTVARRMPGRRVWRVMAQGRVVRCWRENLQRRLVQRLLKRTLRMTDVELASPVFTERMHDFWVRPLRGKRVSVQISGTMFRLGKRSKGSGHFQAPIDVHVDLVGDHGDETGHITVHSQARQLNGNGSTTVADAAPVRLIPPCGTSVISDIDDTIKVSHVHSRSELLANTFLRPFAAVDGMSAAYQKWSQEGCEFHYVSSSPWQLFRPLHRFLDEHEFPDGSYHLRTFRLRDPTNLRMMLAGARSKRKAIRALLKWFPFRQFVLIGDSGERDSRLYAKLAHKHGHQIAQICIRKLPHDKGAAEQRIRKSLADLPPVKWRIFEHGEELGDLIAGSIRGWQFRD